MSTIALDEPQYSGPATHVREVDLEATGRVFNAAHLTCVMSTIAFDAPQCFGAATHVRDIDLEATARVSNAALLTAVMSTIALDEPQYSGPATHVRDVDRETFAISTRSSRRGRRHRSSETIPPSTNTLSPI